VITAGKAVASYYTGGASDVACAAAQGRCDRYATATYQFQVKAAQGVVNKVCNIFTANDAIGLVTQKQFELKKCITQLFDRDMKSSTIRLWASIYLRHLLCKTAWQRYSVPGYEPR
jgi:hypothetical protein